MNHVLFSAQMKECDGYTINEIGIPSMVLMERASFGIAQKTLNIINSKKWKPENTNVYCVCGSGNNGGDGAACARILRESGVNAGIVFVGNAEHASQEMTSQLKIAEKSGVPFFDVKNLSNADIIIDAVFGIGLTRNVEGDYAEIIKIINDNDAVVISADISSGINADTGKVMGIAVKADHTCAIQNLKPGHLLYPGAEYSGNVEICNIGIKNIFNDAVKNIELQDIKELVPKRREDGNKGIFGKVLVFAGSEDICGAAVLSAEAAMRCGAGMVKVITHVNNKDAIIEKLPEAMVSTYSDKEEAVLLLEKWVKWADCAVAGPGIGVSDIAVTACEYIINETDIPIVLDADGLNCCSKNMKLLKDKENIIITPHLGEMSRLSGMSVSDIKEDMLSFARDFADKYRVDLVLKDARTVICSPNGEMYINTNGSSGMATAGSGDVLSGIIGALLARGCETFNAAAVGVYLHAYAGDVAAKKLGKSFMIAGDIIEGLKTTLGNAEI